MINRITLLGHSIFVLEMQLLLMRLLFWGIIFGALSLYQKWLFNGLFKNRLKFPYEKIAPNFSGLNIEYRGLEVKFNVFRFKINNISLSIRIVFLHEM